jgi:hypothetical protein
MWNLCFSTFPRSGRMMTTCNLLHHHLQSKEKVTRRSAFIPLQWRWMSRQSLCKWLKSPAFLRCTAPLCGGLCPGGWRPRNGCQPAFAFDKVDANDFVQAGDNGVICTAFAEQMTLSSAKRCGGHRLCRMPGLCPGRTLLPFNFVESIWLCRCGVDGCHPHRRSRMLFFIS